MKPYPFSALNHLTLPVSTETSIKLGMYYLAIVYYSVVSFSCERMEPDYAISTAPLLRAISSPTARSRRSWNTSPSPHSRSSGSQTACRSLARPDPLDRTGRRTGESWPAAIHATRQGDLPRSVRRDPGSLAWPWQRIAQRRDSRAYTTGSIQTDHPPNGRPGGRRARHREPQCQDTLLSWHSRGPGGRPLPLSR